MKNNTGLHFESHQKLFAPFELFLMVFDALNPKMAFIFHHHVRFFYKTGLKNWKNCVKQEFYLINFYLKNV